MPSVDRVVSVYQELADWHDRRGQTQLRDRFLVLAADTAYAAGRAEEAEELRRVLLQLNPHHLLKSSASFAEARRSTDVQSYLNDLRQSYPPEAAEQLLESLRGEPGSEGNAGPEAARVDRASAKASSAPEGATTPSAGPLKAYRF